MCAITVDSRGFVTDANLVATIRGILEALKEDIEDELSWFALADIGDEHNDHELSSARNVRNSNHAIRRACYLVASSWQGQSQIDNTNWHKGYAEPGYSNPEKGVVTGNWNAVSRYRTSDVNGQYNTTEVVDDAPKLFGDLLEALGLELEWSDEWAECDTCNRIVRTQPDGHNWTPHYEITIDSDIQCYDCCTNEGGRTLEEMLMGGPNHQGYIISGEVYCVECGQDILRAQWRRGDRPLGAAADDSEEWPQPIFSEGNSERAVHCSSCGTHLYGEDPPTIEEDDITTEDFRTFYQNGKVWLEISEEESQVWWEYVDAKVNALENQHFPNVWEINDHGNRTLYDSNGNVVGSWV